VWVVGITADWSRTRKKRLVTGDNNDDNNNNNNNKADNCQTELAAVHVTALSFYSNMDYINMPQENGYKQKHTA
jgi:hypothetical protein